MESNRSWARRLHLPYPLLSDPDAVAARAFAVVRRRRVAGWNLDLFQRATFLIDFNGVVAACWKKVEIRGHAREVMEVVDSLRRPGV